MTKQKIIKKTKEVKEKFIMRVSGKVDSIDIFLNDQKEVVLVFYRDRMDKAGRLKRVLVDKMKI